MKPTVLLLLLVLHAARAQEPPQSDRKWATAKSGLRMRDAPSVDGAKRNLIPYGSSVTWLEEKGEEIRLAGTTGKWAKVNWNNEIGWVFGGFLSDMHPDQANKAFATNNFSVMDMLTQAKWASPLTLCRIELSGTGYTLTDDGAIRSNSLDEQISDSYDITGTFYFEKGITITLNQGYEWGSNTYAFDASSYYVEEIFRYANRIYGEKYRAYLKVEDNEAVLPTRSETRENENEYTTFSSQVENGKFVLFSIDEGDGCSWSWYFQVDGNEIRFGDGGGC